VPPPSSPAPGPPELILHIGSGKTGTSSIQHLLHRNRDRLAEEGVLYPRSPGPVRHARLGLYVKRDAELTGTVVWHRQGHDSPAQFRRVFRRRLRAEIDRARPTRVLMSDEALFGSSEEALERLRRFTDRIAGPVRLVVYLRRQDDHLVSRYQQRVKFGDVNPLADRLQHPELARTYDYRARLEAWERLLEPAALVVRRFEPDGFVGGSLFEDFFDAAGLDLRLGELDQVGPQNVSLDAEAVEFLRILNLYRVEHEGAEPGRIDNRELFTQLFELPPGPTLTLPGPLLDDFMARWEDSNRAVARRYLGDEDGELFRTPRKTRDTTDRQRLDPARLDHFLGFLELPGAMHAPLRRIAEREAARH
jgi:hypothetical protein